MSLIPQEDDGPAYFPFTKADLGRAVLEEREACAALCASGAERYAEQAEVQARSRASRYDCQTANIVLTNVADAIRKRLDGPPVQEVKPDGTL